MTKIQHCALVVGLLVAVACGAPPDRLAGETPDAKPSDAADAADAANACARTFFEESARWAACMDFAQWEQTGMGTVAFQETDEGSPCHLCHHSGVGGNYLNPDSRDTFDAMHELPFLGMLVLGSYDESECFVDLVRSTLLLAKDDAPTRFHPAFEWDDSREAAIVNFFDLTHAKYLAHDCGDE